VSAVLPILRGGPRPDAGLPLPVSSHKSGGRDQWSPPLETAPADPVAAAWDALGEVLDPEIPISLVELGLVYGVEYRQGVVRVDITFTATACPCMEFIREDITDRLEQEPWIREVRIEEVWSPPWTTERISPEGRRKLRTLGVSA
jgi:metal-sulfur cluster biosynthetic enzyme